MLGSKLILELGPYIILVSSSFQKIASVTVLLVAILSCRPAICIWHEGMLLCESF